MANKEKYPDEVFKVFFENNIDLLCIADTDGRFTKLNPEWERTLGYSLSELEGELFINYVHPEDVEKTVEATKQLANNQKVQNFINRYRHKNGTYRWIEWRSFPVNNLIYATARDITGKVETEKALAKSEKRYRALIEDQTDLVSRYLPDTTLTYANDAYCKFYGKKREEIIGKSYLFMIAPEFRELVKEETLELSKNNTSIKGEYLNYRYDGKECWIQWVVKSITDENGNVVELQAVGRDVSEIKNTEEALKQSEEFIKGIAQNIPGIIFQFCVKNNGKYGFNYVSNNSQHYLGLDNKNLDNYFERFIKGLPEDEHQVFLDSISEAVNHESTWKYEGTFIKSNGEKRFFRSISEPTRISNMLVFDGIYLDITETKLAEKELEYNKTLLESSVLQSPIPMVIASAPDNIIRLTNKAAGEYLGIPNVSEYIGKSLSEIELPLQDYDEQGNPIPDSELPLALALRGIDTKNRILSIKLKDGTVKFESVSSTSIRNSKGDIIAAYLVLLDITDRKLAEGKIKQLADMQQTILSALSVGVALVEKNKIEWTNASMCQMFGYDKQELTGANANLFSVTEGYYEEVENQGRKFLENGDVFSSEIQLKRKDGYLIWCKAIGKSINPKDLSLGIIWMLQDITESKKAEDEFKQLAGLHQTILDTISMGLVYIVESRLQWANNSFCQTFGYNSDEIKDKHISLFYKNEEEYEGIKNESINILLSGGAYVKEFEGKRKDGSLTILKMIGRALNYKEPTEGTVWMLQDISESKKAEKEFKQLAKLHQTILDTVDVGFIFLKDRKVQWVNNTFIDLFGYKFEEIVNKETFIFHASDQESEIIGNEALVALVNGGEYSVETQAKRKDGSVFFMHLVGKTMNPENLTEGSIWMVEDITERKKNEEELIKNQKLLSDSQKAANIGGWEYIIDEDNLIWTEQTYDIYGIKDKSLKPNYKISMDLVHPEDRRFVEEEYLNAIKTSLFHEFEYRIIHPDKSIRNVKIIGKVEYKNDKPFRTYGILQDITERKIAEEALMKSQKLLTESQRVAQIGCWENDLVENRMTWNEEAYKIFGYDYMEIEPTYEGYKKITHPDDLPYAMSILKDIIQTKTFKDHEYRIIRKDGEIRTILVVGDVELNDKNEVFRSFGIIQDITERKKVEEEFRQLASLNQIILDSVSLGLIFAKDRKVQWVNNALAKMFGYEYDELIGQDTLMFYADENSYHKVGNEAYPILSKGESYFTELMGKNKKGDLFWCHIASKAVNPENLSEGSLWIVTDITERKKYEEDLLKNQKMLTESQRLARMGSWELNLSDNKIFWNREAFQIHGYQDQAIEPDLETFFERVHPDDLGLVKAHYEKTLQTKIYDDLECRIVRPDGAIRSIIVVGEVFSDNTGKPSRMFGIVQDITDRKMSEEALKKRMLALTRPLEDIKDIDFTDLFNIDDLQKIQDTFAEATGVASIITYPDGTPITKPSNFCMLCNLIRSTEKGRMNCYKSDAYIGRQNPSGPIIQPCISGGLWDAGASITLGGVHVANWLIGQVRNEALDDEKMLKYGDEIGVDRDLYREALEKVRSMSTEQFEKISEALYILANELSLKAYQNVQQARFITELKKSEGEIRKLNSELEIRVKQRTSQLETAITDLESFAYSVSHDLRAPLRHINGFLSLMYSSIELPNQKIKKYHEKIISSSKRMSDMIDNLLAFSRLGRKDIAFNTIHMDNLIEEIITQILPDTKNYNIEWKIEQLPIIQGDENLIKLAFENLISNAIKYSSRRDKIVIEIGCKIVENQIEFFVKDNGVGFDMNFAKKLFGVFQRLHNEEEFEGIGIGLANVKQIINKHGGSVWAESELDQGATFHILLPK